MLGNALNGGFTEELFTCWDRFRVLMLEYGNNQLSLTSYLTTDCTSKVDICHPLVCCLGLLEGPYLVAVPSSSLTAAATWSIHNIHIMVVRVVVCKSQSCRAPYLFLYCYCTRLWMHQKHWVHVVGQPAVNTDQQLVMDLSSVLFTESWIHAGGTRVQIFVLVQKTRMFPISIWRSFVSLRCFLPN